MKMCPKCSAENKDSNYECTNCQEYIGNTPLSGEKNSDSVVDHMFRRDARRKVILYVSFLGFFAIAFLFFLYILYDATGSIYPAMQILPLYLIPIFLLVFPCNKVYCHYRKVRKLERKSVPDIFVALFKCAAVISLFILFGITYDYFNQIISLSK